MLPTTASAQVNFRIIPGETTEFVKKHVEEIINDERIEVKMKEGIYVANPSKISSTSSFGYNALQKTSREIFPEAIVSPSLVIAQTDSRYFSKICDNVFRFSPMQLNNDDLKRIHGIDERISIKNYKQSIQYYYQLILNSCI